MTENKRFTQKDESIINTQTDELVNASSEESAKIIISWLNELFDKNAELMKENYGLLDGLAYKEEVEIPKLSERISDLECENEQLKKQLNDITLNWTQNHIEFDKDELYVKDNNTEIILKGGNLFIQVFIPQIQEYFRFNYIVTGRKLEKEYNTLKGDVE